MPDEPIITGLVPTTPPPTPSLPDGWTIQRASEFIGDLATNMYDLNYVLAKHHISRTQYDSIKDNPFFVTTLTAFAKDWHKPESVQKRLALKAAIIVEDSMPVVGKRLHTSNEPLPGIVELLKLYSKIAGLGDEGAPKISSNERFQININLGADTEKYDKAKQPVIEVEKSPVADVHMLAGLVKSCQS
jgi:hypothetical protein